MHGTKRAHSRLSKCDETGITNVQHRYTNLTGLPWSSEKGMSRYSRHAAVQEGTILPSPLTFLRKIIKLRIMQRAPSGSIYGRDPSERIQMVPSFHSGRKTYRKRPHLTRVRLAKFTHKEFRHHKFEQRASSCSNFFVHTSDKQDVALYLIFMPLWRPFPSKKLIVETENLWPHCDGVGSGWITGACHRTPAAASAYYGGQTVKLYLVREAYSGRRPSVSWNRTYRNSPSFNIDRRLHRMCKKLI
jgi:hypothetical protein